MKQEMAYICWIEILVVHIALRSIEITQNIYRNKYFVGQYLGKKQHY